MAFYLNYLYIQIIMNSLNENIIRLNVTRKNTPLIKIIRNRRKRTNYEKKTI